MAGTTVIVYSMYNTPVSEHTLAGMHGDSLKHLLCVWNLRQKSTSNSWQNIIESYYNAAKSVLRDHQRPVLKGLGILLHISVNYITSQ